MFSKLSMLMITGCVLTVMGFHYSNQTPSPTPTLTPTPTPDLGVGFLVTITGTVYLERVEWSDFYTTSWGVSLKRNDRIKIGSSTKAKILCDDLTVHNVYTRYGRNIGYYCKPPDSGSAFTGDGIAVARTRAVSESSIPYIIRPRNTKLLTTTPILRWHAVPTATTYTVMVNDGLGHSIWSTQTITTELVYQGDALQPGKSYKVIVETDTGSSSEQEDTSPFTIIDTMLATEVLTKAEQIQSQQLSDEVKQLALAQLYANYDLRAEAIDLLEELVEAGTEQEMVYYTLGTFYHQLKLLTLAEPHYLKASEKAKTMGIVEIQADVHSMLGHIYNSYIILEPTYKDKAIEQFKIAKNLYELLGDTEQAKKIEVQLAELQ